MVLLWSDLYVSHKKMHLVWLYADVSIFVSGLTCTPKVKNLKDLRAKAFWLSSALSVKAGNRKKHRRPNEDNLDYKKMREN